MRVPIASVNAGLRGPRLEALEAIALYGCGAVADGRLQKYLGSLKLWPMIRGAHRMHAGHHQAALGLVVEQQLRKAGLRRTDPRSRQQGHDEEQGHSRSDDCIHGNLKQGVSAPRPTSMSLMPTTGMMMPPRP